MLCPKCQVNISDTAKSCIHCGYQFNNIISENNTEATNSTISNNINKNKNLPKAMPDKIKWIFICSILNILFIIPLVFRFGVLWFFLGALPGSAPLYYTVLYTCIGYMVFSIIFFFISLSKTLKYTKKYIRYAVVCGLLALLLIGGIYSYNDYIAYKSSQKNNTNHSEATDTWTTLTAKDSTLYEDSNIRIVVDRIAYDKDKVELILRLENHSDIYYNFNIHKLMINDIDMIFGVGTSSNLNAMNKWVAPAEVSNNYVVSIWTHDLQNQNIYTNKIEKLSFKLLIYYDSAGFDGEGQIAEDQYYTIEIE